MDLSLIRLNGGSLLVDHGCFSRLTWRLKPRDGYDLSAFADGLAGDGWNIEQHTDLLLIVRHASERHSVVIAVSTGRVQLRLDYLTPRKQRVHQARFVAQALLDHMAAS